MNGKIARDTVQDTLKLLSQKQKNCEQKFRTIYEGVSGIATVELGTNTELPRSCGGKIHHDDPHVYCRQSIYILIIENVTEDIRTRFPEGTIQLDNLSILFPRFNFDADDSIVIIRQIAEKYITFFNASVETLHGETMETLAI